MILLCMAVIFTAMPVMPVYAETEETAVPTLTVSGNSAYAGNSVRVDVNAADLSNLGVMEFQLHYDPDVMTVSSCSAGSLISSAYNDINTANSGEIRVSAMKVAGISGSGCVLRIYFTVSSDAVPGDYPVTITVGSVCDPELNPITLSKISGSITVLERSVSPTSITFNRSCDRTSVEQGDTLNYTLKATYGYGLTAGNFNFIYDRSLLQLNEVTLGETLATDTAITAVNTNTPGYVKVSFADLEELPVYYGSELVKLNFTVIGDVDETTYIDFSADTLCDYNGNGMTSNSHSQSITLKKKEVVIDYPDLKLSANGDFDEEARTFTIDVSLEEGANVAAGDFYVSYDKSQVVCTSLAPSTEASSGKAMFMSKEDIGGGTVKFAYINTEPFETELKLATLTFKAEEGHTGDTVIIASGSGVKDKTFTDITLDYPELTVSVPKLKAEITGTREYSKTYGDSLFKLDAVTTNTDAEAVLTYQSSSETVAQVNSDGEVLITGAGQAVITVSCPETENYKACSGTVTVNVEPADISNLSLSVAGPVAYTGSALKPAVTIAGLLEGRDFIVNYENNVNVGTANVTVNGQGNYKGQLTGTFEITAASLGLTSDDIQLGSYDAVYDGTAKEPAVAIQGMTQGTDYTVSYTNNVNAGEATVTVTGCGNYSGSASKTFPIEKASLSGRVLTLTYDAPYVYDNTYKYPDASIRGLTAGTDFAVSYSNHKNAGEATVTAAGRGNYTGTTTAVFTIERALLPEEHIAVSGSGEYEYSGSAFTPTVRVGTLNRNTDYTVTYQNNTNAGQAAILIEGIGNYKGSFERNFTIHPTSITAYEWDAYLSQESYTYDGSAKTPKVTIADDYLKEDTDFEVTYLTNVNAGQAAAQVTGKGNYKDSFLLFFGIDPAPITDEMVQLGSYDKVYSGSAKEPEVIVGGGKLMKETDYEVSYSNNINAGDKASVTVTGKDNYTGTVTKTFEITPASLNGDMFSLPGVPVIYNGSMHAPDVIAAEGLEYGKDYTVTYENKTDVGTATVIIEGRGNYEGTVKKDFAINPAVLTEADASLAYTQTGYNGSPQIPGVTVTKFGRELNEGTDFEVVSYTDNTNVGTAAVTIRGKGNFTGTIQKQFEILEHGLTAGDITLADSEVTYNGQPHMPKVTIDGHVEGTDFEVTYAKNTNVGTADVTVKGIGNHAGTVILHFTIKPADISEMKAMLGEYDAVYDGSGKKPSVTIEGLTEGVDFETVYENNVNAGQASVTITGKGNYTGTITESFAITAKSLNGDIIVLSDEPVIYNGAFQEPAVTIEGLKAGVDYKVSYDNNQNAGQASVTVKGIGNYTGTVTKKFTIAAAPIQEDAIGLAYEAVTYSGTAKEPTVTIGNLKTGTDFKVEYFSNVNAGVANVKITGMGNYAGTYEKTFTIHPAQLDAAKVIFGEYDLVYNGSEKTPLVYVGDLMEGMDYTVQYDRNKNAGEADVTITGQGNYIGTIVKHFSISRAPLDDLKVRLDEYDAVYDGSEKKPEVAIEGLKSGTDYTVAYADNVNAGREAKAIVTGQGNYIGEVTKYFEITAASLNNDMFTLAEGPFVYNGSQQKPNVEAGNLMEGEDFDVVYSENEKAGEATVTITGKGNYAGTVTKKFTIDRATFSKEDVTLGYSETEYTGKPQGPNVMVAGLVKDRDYTVEYTDNINAGQASVIVKGIGNYTGVLNAAFHITPADLGMEDIRLSYAEIPYSGTERKPSVTVAGLKSGTDYDVTYASNINAGQAAVTITGKGNYTGTVTKYFAITPLDLSAWTGTPKLEYRRTQYDGTAKKPAVTLAGLTEGVDFEVSYADNVEVGTAKVIITGKGNCTGTRTEAFAIVDILTLLGDVNLDGEVTASDLTMLARHVAKIETITNADSLANAEVTGNDELTAEDLTKLARYVAKIIDSLE